MEPTGRHEIENAGDIPGIWWLRSSGFRLQRQVDEREAHFGAGAITQADFLGRI